MEHGPDNTMAAQRAERGLQIYLYPAQLTSPPGLEQLYQRDAEPDHQLHRDIAIVGRSLGGVVELGAIVRGAVVIARCGGHVAILPRDFEWRGFDGVERYAYGVEVAFEKWQALAVPWDARFDGVCARGYDELVHTHEDLEGF